MGRAALPRPGPGHDLHSHALGGGPWLVHGLQERPAPGPQPPLGRDAARHDVRPRRDQPVVRVVVPLRGPSTSVTVTICIGIVNIVLVIVIGILQPCRTRASTESSSEGLLLLPQFALPSSFFGLALKPSSSPPHLRRLPRPARESFVPGAPPKSPRRDLDCLTRGVTTRRREHHDGLPQPTAPVSAFDEAVVSPEVKASSAPPSRSSGRARPRHRLLPAIGAAHALRLRGAPGGGPAAVEGGRRRRAGRDRA